MALGSGAYSGQYGFVSRCEDGPGTNPEELLAAARAGCCSMAVANLLAPEDTPATAIDTEATVHLVRVDGEPTITRVGLASVGEVAGIDEATGRGRHGHAARPRPQAAPSSARQGGTRAILGRVRCVPAPPERDTPRSVWTRTWRATRRYTEDAPDADRHRQVVQRGQGLRVHPAR
ncbi:MAG: OsmC family peroxiredoxin [Nitriliruptor sp.]|nr:MAG: OsmC family peroxiredoxin [Nitriliruptor sp.]